MRPLLLTACGFLLIPSLLQTADRDEELIRAAGVATDGPGLLAYFRKRTPDEADRKAIEEHVRNLGSRSFSVRERAFEALRKRGTPAIPYLKSALSSRDLEVVKRAERCLGEIDRGPGPDLALAAVRLLARKSPTGSSATLLAFVPHADDDNVEEAVLESLAKLNPTTGKPDPALVAALNDTEPLRRAAAAYVLGQFPGEPLRANLRKLLADRDTRVRFRTAQGLLMGRDRSAVPGLMALLADAPLGVAWQAEELLIRLAGEESPIVAIGNGEGDARAKCRDAWEKWWKKSGDKADLSRVEEVRRLLGLTLVVEYNTNRVWECGPEGLARWDIRNVNGPMDAWVLPGQRVLLADADGVSERDLTGRVLRRFEGTSGASGCQRLTNGNTFVATYSQVMEFNAESKKLYQHGIGGSNAIRKRRGGTIIYTTNAHIIEMDVAGKQVRTVPLPPHAMWVGLEELDGNRYLVANSTTGRVIEVDVAGKILWETTVPGACGIARLPTGTTLVATSLRIVEVDRQGKIIWEKKATGYARRIHRR